MFSRQSRPLLNMNSWKYRIFCLYQLQRIEIADNAYHSWGIRRTECARSIRNGIGKSIGGTCQLYYHWTGPIEWRNWTMDNRWKLFASNCFGRWAGINCVGYTVAGQTGRLCIVLCHFSILHRAVYSQLELRSMLSVSGELNENIIDNDTHIHYRQLCLF